jgi:hypothetical protein
LLTYSNILRILHRAAEAGPVQARAEQILVGFKASQQSITFGALATRPH